MTDVQILCQGGENPFASQIVNFLIQDFPGSTIKTNSQLVDTITSILVSSNQVRFGPAPNPESLVSIRDVIRRSVAAGAPIPILTPFGSRKSRTDEVLDIAELAALKQLSGLNSYIAQHYSPGIHVNIRLEDASGHYLFHDEGQTSRDATQRYCDDFQTLVRVLNLGHVIHPVLESQLFDEQEYAATADSIVPLLMTYITETDSLGFDNIEKRDSWRNLVEIGWKGTIPTEQRNYYRERYRRLYQGINDFDATMKLARYLAGSLARIKHKGTGVDEAWGNDYVRVTFVNPVPGAPEGITSRNIYYRTLPLKYATTHMPAWRAKGFLKINHVITPKIASWGDANDYQPNMVIFRRGTESVTVQADYLICD